MAFSGSGIFRPTWLDVFDVTQLAIDLDAETHRCALFTNSVTPDYDADTAYGVAPWNANEAVGAGYTAGGELVTTTTFTGAATGVVRWDADNVVWTAATISARGALYYADALPGDNAICAQDFGSDFASTNGTYTVQQPAAGIFEQDLVP